MVKEATGKSFEVIDHTADVGIIAYGAEIKQVFVNAALALFSLITELDNVGEEYLYDIVSRGQSLSALSMVRITLSVELFILGWLDIVKGPSFQRIKHLNFPKPGKVVLIQDESLSILPRGIFPVEN